VIEFTDSHSAKGYTGYDSCTGNITSTQSFINNLTILVNSGSCNLKVKIIGYTN
jgi:hypothetical protein